MPEHSFRLLQNGFEIQTQGSNKKAISLSTDTMDKLNGAGIPALTTIFNNYQPHHDAYMALNLAVELTEGTYHGKTLSFENIIDSIKDKLKLWEGPIRAVFPEDSPTEVEIFPQKRTPFYTGTYEQRLLRVKVLRDKLLEFTVANPSLVPVQADVAAFYTLALAARTLQQGKEGNIGSLRTEREAQRVLTMGAYWGIVYGGLLTNFYATPDEINDYIDLGLLYHNKNEVLFATVNVAGAGLPTNLPLTGLTLTANTKLRIKNKTEVAGGLGIAYFAASPIITPGDPPAGIVFNLDDNRLLKISVLGYDAVAKPYLNFFAPAGTPIVMEVWVEH